MQAGIKSRQLPGTLQLIFTMGYLQSSSVVWKAGTVLGQKLLKGWTKSLPGLRQWLGDNISQIAGWSSPQDNMSDFEECVLLKVKELSSKHSKHRINSLPISWLRIQRLARFFINNPQRPCPKNREDLEFGKSYQSYNPTVVQFSH